MSSEYHGPLPRQKSLKVYRDGSKRTFEVFICSEAGKPIYCFNDSRDDEFVVTFMGVCQALINFFIDSEKDLLKTITTARGLRITFAVKTPLILVVVTDALSPISPNLVINQVFSQIISILTLKTLKSVFEQRPTFDLRRLLSGSDKLIDTLIDDCLVGNPLYSRQQLTSKASKAHAPFEVFGFLTSTTTQQLNNLRPSSQTGAASPAILPNTPLLTNNSKSRGHGGRVLIPVLPLNPSIRDSITNTIMSSITTTPSNVLFAVLFQIKVRSYGIPGPDFDADSTRIDQTDDASCLAGDKIEASSPNTESPVEASATSESNQEERDFNKIHLITIVNYNVKKAKLHPLDIQLLQGLVIASDCQLSSAESLWLPICLPRVDSGAFIHAHISYLNQLDLSRPSTPSNTGASSSASSSSNTRLCLVLLTADREDFSRCQHTKELVNERLNKVQLQASGFSDLNISQVQSFYYQSVKPYSLLYRSWPHLDQTAFNKLVAYIAYRMMESKLKMLWLQSDRHQTALLGWRTSSFSFFGQFDATITPNDVITVAANIQKWVKKEEDKVKLRDYQ